MQGGDTARNPNSQPVGHLVRNLEIMDFNVFTYQTPRLDAVRFTSEFLSAITFILLQLPNLQHFENCRSESWYPKLPHVASLAQVAGAACTSLTLKVRRDEDGIFATINKLRRLEQLIIFIPAFEIASDESPEWTHQLKTAVVGPSISYMCWSVQGYVDPNMLVFLAACRFAPSCTIELQLANMLAQDANQLAPLFIENSVDVLELSCVKPDVQSVLAPIIVNVPTVKILDCAPSPELGRQSRLPTAIFVDYIRGIESEAHFWGFLRTVQAATYISPERCAIRVFWGNIQFSWIEGDESKEYATFVGQLLLMSANLMKRNIFIVDRRGMHCGSMWSKYG
jgi:hypothetical protein